MYSRSTLNKLYHNVWRRFLGRFLCPILWYAICSSTPAYAKKQPGQKTVNETKQALLARKQRTLAKKKALKAEQIAKQQQKQKQIVGRRQEQSKASSFKQEQLNEMFRSVTHVGVATGLIWGFHAITTSPFQLSTLLAPVVSGLATKPLESIGSSFATLFMPFLTKPQLRQALDLKKQYERRKHTLSPSMKNFIESIIDRHICSIKNWNYFNKEYENVIQEVLKFPTGPKKVIPNVPAIKQFLTAYPLAVRQPLAEFVASVEKDAQHLTLATKRTPMMFLGPPGTGKTHLANNIGALLGLPVQVIDLSKYKNIHGSSFYNSDPEKGILVETLVGEHAGADNWSNKMLILDEIDKVLAVDKNGRFISDNGSAVYSLLLTLLEPQETAARLSRYEHATADISQLKIILLGNKTFSETMGNGEAAALESRVKIVRFEAGFDQAQKQLIVQEKMDRWCKAYGIDPSSIDPKMIDAIIAEDIHLGNKGVRILLSVVGEYLNRLSQEPLIDAIIGKDSTHFDVQKAYLPYIPPVT